MSATEHAYWLLDVVARPVTQLFRLDESINIYWLACAILFTGLAIVAFRIGRRRLPRLRAFLRFVFSRRVLAHPSSLLDYKLYAVNSILLASVLTVFVVGAEFWMNATRTLLEAVLGPAPTAAAPSTAVFLLTTTLQILAIDFGYWAMHYLFHKIPVLWEFHKVHHSAEVMTPATELRQHPVELVAFPLCYGFTSGVVYGAVAHAFGPEAHQLGLFGQNCILMLHLATFHHLRHSHIRMPFTGLWGKLLHSPAHHHVHHSDNPKHFDRNLGYMLSIWDWMFGTLYQPVKGEKIVFGIGHEGHTHTSIRVVMWQPVVQAAALARRQIGEAIARRRPPAGETNAEVAQPAATATSATP